MKRRTGFNPKRRIREMVDGAYLERLISSIRYGGNPEHKRNPGDFGLTPPSQPRADKALCDVVGIFTRQVATSLLVAGVKKGLISERDINGFPQNIWAVTEDGYALEAQLNDVTRGEYHGYPMPPNDPFREVVLKKWSVK